LNRKRNDNQARIAHCFKVLEIEPTDSALTEHVPVGKYRLKYAVGKTWDGKRWLFGSRTVYHRMQEALEFEFRQNEIIGYRVNLYLAPTTGSRANKHYQFDF
jgi:hypothetical protein